MRLFLLAYPYYEFWKKSYLDFKLEHFGPCQYLPSELVDKFRSVGRGKRIVCWNRSITFVIKILEFGKGVLILISIKAQNFQ